MKKISLILLVLVLIFFLSACSEQVKENNTRFETVSQGGYGIVIRDTYTGVHYFCRSYGGMVVMVNPDGTPYVD